MSGPFIAEEENVGAYDKFLGKARQEPFVPLGILGTAAVVGYGIYNYKNRGNMSTSMYLMGLRVRSQAVVVGAITVGITYQLCKDYLFTKKEE